MLEPASKTAVESARIRVVAGKRPLVPAALFMMLGILASAYVQAPLPVCLTAALAVAIVSAILFALKVDIILPLYLFCFLAGASLLTASLPKWAADPWAPSQPVNVRGYVVSEGTTRSGYRQYTLDGVTLGGKVIDGRVLITARDASAEAMEGGTLTATLQLKRPEPSRYFGGFNARGYYLRQGIRFTAFAATLACTKPPADTTVWSLPRRARRYADDVLKRCLSPESAALVSALLSGDKSGISDEISDSFIDLGAAHLLAVSGLNISLTAGAAWLLCRKLRVPMPVSFALSFMVMVSYVLFAGPTPSVERAAVMWAAMMAGVAAARRYDPLSSISAAAIVILALNPLDLFDAGFQLSFLATAAMFLWLAPLMRHMPEKRWMKAVAGAAGVTIVVTAFALPVLLNNFHSVSVTSPLANLVLVPTSFVLQLGGTALLCVGFIPGISGLMGMALDGAAQIYLQNVRLLDWTGAAIHAATPPVWLCAVFAMLVFAASPSLVRLSKGMRASVVLALAAVISLMLIPLPGALSGRGDAAIVAESGKSISVYWQNAGKRYAAFSGGTRELAGYLKSRGISRLDGLYAVRAKPPGDGTLLDDLEGIRADTLYVPDAWLANPDAETFLGKGVILGMRPQGMGEKANNVDILSLAFPVELARTVRAAYNITERGSVEIWQLSGQTALVPWRNGWENGIQGNFR